MIFTRLRSKGSVNARLLPLLIHSIFSIHSGAPLYSLNFGPSTTQIGEVKVPINKVTLEECRRKLEVIVRMID